MTGPGSRTWRGTSSFARCVQFDKRMKVLERDYGKTIAEIERAALADLMVEEAAGAAL